MKTYHIDVQALRSATHDKGLIELDLDVSVRAHPPSDDQPSVTSLRLPAEQARVLLALLKQQLGELDKLQPRSRRSGRC